MYRVVGFGLSHVPYHKARCLVLLIGLASYVELLLSYKHTRTARYGFQCAKARRH